MSPKAIDPRKWPNRDPENQKYALQHSWPAQLARLMNCQHVNLSKPGCSNDHIVRTSLDHLAKTPGSDQLVVIAWTEPSRRDLHLIDHINHFWPNHPPHGYYSFRASSNDVAGYRLPDRDLLKWAQRFYRYGWDEVESHVRYYTQVVLLTSYLKQRRTPYLYLYANHDPHLWQQQQQGYAAELTKPLYDQIDWNDFISGGVHNRSIISMFRNDLDRSMHLTLQGHQLLASMIYQEIKDRELITV